MPRMINGEVCYVVHAVGTNQAKERASQLLQWPYSSTQQRNLHIDFSELAIDSSVYQAADALLLLCDNTRESEEYLLQQAPIISAADKTILWLDLAGNLPFFTHLASNFARSFVVEFNPARGDLFRAIHRAVQTQINALKLITAELKKTTSIYLFWISRLAQMLQALLALHGLLTNTQLLCNLSLLAATTRLLSSLLYLVYQRETYFQEDTSYRRYFYTRHAPAEFRWTINLPLLNRGHLMTADIANPIGFLPARAAVPLPGPNPYSERFEHIQQMLEATLDELKQMEMKSSGASLSELLVSAQQLEAAFKKFDEEHSCPIALRIMHEPVVLASGQFMNKDSLSVYVRNGGNHCPLTRIPLNLNIEDLATLPIHTERQASIEQGLTQLEGRFSVLEAKLAEYKQKAPQILSKP